MTGCKPKVVANRGIAPGVRGVAMLRILGFRGHCECGWLGPRRDNHFNAQRDVREHRIGREVTPKVAI